MYSVCGYRLLKVAFKPPFYLSDTNLQNIFYKCYCFVTIYFIFVGNKLKMEYVLEKLELMLAGWELAKEQHTQLLQLKPNDPYCTKVLLRCIDRIAEINKAIEILKNK